jgi:putative membrane protein
MRTLIAAIAAVALVGTAAYAQQKTAETKAPAEATTFARNVAAANTFEIQSSELAQQRAQSAEVKSFAQKMISDHTKAGQEFKSALQAADISPPPEQLDAKQKATLAKLQKEQGAAFDKAYISAQLTGHQQAVALFRNYSKAGKTAPLKDFAQKTLPTIEQHLTMVQDLSKPGATAQKQAPTGTGGAAIGPPADKGPQGTKK